MSPDIKLMALNRKKSSDGSDTELIALNVTKNGTYRAPLGKGYSPVNVMTQEIDEETGRIRHIFSVQTNTPVFNDGGTYTGQLPGGYFKEIFGDYLEINCPNAYFLGGGAAFLPYSRTGDKIYTPETVKIVMGPNPVTLCSNFYGASGTILSSVNETGVKTFILRSGDSSVIKIKATSNCAFRNNVTKSFDCIFDFSAVTGNITNLFGSAVEDITFLENCVRTNLSLVDSGRLSTESILSVANSLKTVTSPLTLTLHSDTKQLLNEIYVGTTDATFKGESFRYAAQTTPQSEGAMTLAYFITQIKGWTIA